MRLNCHGTIADVAASGVELREGLGVTVSDEELRADATVVRSADEGIWVAAIDWDRVAPPIVRIPGTRVRNRARSIVEKSLSSALSNIEFEKLGGRYVRERGGVLQMVEPQMSRWNDETQIRFTLDCGVYVSGVTAMFRGVPEPKPPTLADRCAGFRLDTWWTLFKSDDGDREGQLADEVRSATLGSILPFLDNLSSEEHVARYLSLICDDRDAHVEPRIPTLRCLYAALAWAKLGNYEAANQRLQEARSEASGTPLEDFVTRFVERWE